jgi:hypothetical protein
MTAGFLAGQFLLALTQILICVAHAVVLYRLCPTGRSDGVRFLLAPVVAFGLHFALFRRWLGMGGTRGMRGALGLSGVLTFLGGWAGMVAALNTYGS